ncbi:MAG: redoxin domain-containing protein [Betaproteobacteria bacterium]|nr:redoxin domain-containing protein [Betaproteobacteria bacterium]
MIAAAYIRVPRVGRTIMAAGEVRQYRAAPSDAERRNNTNHQNQEETVKRFILAITLPFVLFAFSGMAAAIEVGDKAPDFDLVSTQGGRFKLSSFLGKKSIVIQFYVLDSTPT